MPGLLSAAICVICGLIPSALNEPQLNETDDRQNSGCGFDYRLAILQGVFRVPIIKTLRNNAWNEVLDPAIATCVKSTSRTRSMPTFWHSMALYLVIESTFQTCKTMDRYNDAESRGTRAQKLGSLDRFITALLELPQPVWMKWAIDFACNANRRISPADSFPLVRTGTVSFAATGNESRTHGSFRLLAVLFSKLHNSKTCLNGIPEELRSPEMLLREEFRWHG